VHNALARGKAIGASAIQVFTKTPNQWREPALSEEARTVFRRECDRSEIARIVAHDSYLINLASPDPTLAARSAESFVAELRRCHALGIGAVVSHPGNFIDEREAGLHRNAEAYTRCLEAVPGPVMVLLETTAGTGSALGSTLEELARLRDLIGAGVRHRIGFCADTCHLYSAGYDLVGDYDGVWSRWESVLGLAALRCLHLNDSKTPFGSRRDRHELIGEGSLGAGRSAGSCATALRAKGDETPKGDDGHRSTVACWTPARHGRTRALITRRGVHLPPMLKPTRLALLLPASPATLAAQTGITSASARSGQQPAPRRNRSEITVRQSIAPMLAPAPAHQPRVQRRLARSPPALSSTEWRETDLERCAPAG
jgi:deoxyribonuclease-4